VDFFQVNDGFIKVDSPDREVDQDNAKHDAENEFLIHGSANLAFILVEGELLFGQIVGDFVVE
jgi:hypothetical protein